MCFENFITFRERLYMVSSRVPHESCVVFAGRRSSWYSIGASRAHARNTALLCCFSRSIVLNIFDNAVDISEHRIDSGVE